MIGDCFTGKDQLPSAVRDSLRIILNRRYSDALIQIKGSGIITAKRAAS